MKSEFVSATVSVASMFLLILVSSSLLLILSPSLPEWSVPELVQTVEETVAEPSATISAPLPLYQPFQATAYCIKGITAAGVRVRRGIVAADPEVLPIGSVIEIQAGRYSGIYTVMDTGGAVKGTLIDIYIPDYDEALQFGRQRIQIRILRYGWNHTIDTTGDPSGVAAG